MLFAAAWVLESSGAAFWNDFACGAAICLLALMSAAATEQAKISSAPWYRR
jgi:hypothetical protein